MSDAKWPDAQAGFEKGVTVTAAALAGGEVSEVVGTMARPMTPPTITASANLVGSARVSFSSITAGIREQRNIVLLRTIGANMD